MSFKIYRSIFILSLFITTFNACTTPNTETKNEPIETIKEEAKPTKNKPSNQLVALNQVKVGRNQLQGKLTNTTGKELQISEYKGQYIYLKFWATWCSPCIEQIPDFYETAEKYKDENIEFLLISIDGELAYWQKYVQEKDWLKNSFWIGEEGQQNDLYNYVYTQMEIEGQARILTALPAHILISPEGKILLKDKKKMSEEELERLTDFSKKD